MCSGWRTFRNRFAYLSRSLQRTWPARHLKSKIPNQSNIQLAQSWAVGEGSVKDPAELAGPAIKKPSPLVKIPASLRC